MHSLASQNDLATVPEWNVEAATRHPGDLFSIVAESALDGTIRGMDATLAALLLALCSPAIAIVYVLYKLIERDGGPFLYRGQRLGRHGHLFTMYKIRTLSVDAESRLQGRLHRKGERLETRLGPFLRDTRLDELPQLINVLRGDMAMVGPRPERVSVYHAMCRNIPGYSRRLDFRPGLTGLSQFLTPHGTSKRIRTRIDLLLIRKMRSPLWRLFLVAWTGWAICRKLLRKAGRAIRRLAGVGQRGVAPCDVMAVRESERGSARMELRPLHITAQALHATSRHELANGERVHISVSRRLGRRQRHVRCTGVVSRLPDRELAGHDRHMAYRIHWEPATEFDRYRLVRYVLQDTVA